MGVSGGTRTLRILLVEDHPDTLHVLQRLLRWDGHDVMAADGFDRATSLAGESAFDLLVADIILGDGCGWTLMEQLRGMNPAIEGIAMSGYAQPEHVRRSIEAGFCVHLAKPVNFAEMRDAIRRCVSNRSAPGN